MRPKSFMLIAGEPSGDLLAAELVRELRLSFAEAKEPATGDLQPLETSLEPRFFGAGGEHMSKAGVELAFDMTSHAVVGLVEVLKNLPKFKRLMGQLLQLARERQPDVIICVDFSGFNRRFAHALKKWVRARSGPFNNWEPKLVQYVSPQVWASRESRAQTMSQDFDLVLSIFPFEKDWYKTHAPGLRVEYVGHPILDRYARADSVLTEKNDEALPAIVLLPGSRAGELERHLPVMQGAASLIAAKRTVHFQMCLPNQALADMATGFKWPSHTILQVGGLGGALEKAQLAIASTGTVTMECAYFGVPTLAIYKTSWGTYQIARRIIRVNFLAMPNLLAGEAIYPEFIQHAATPENLAQSAGEFLDNPARQQTTRARLRKVIEKLGPPGASRRAARAVMSLLEKKGARETAERLRNVGEGLFIQPCLPARKPVSTNPQAFPVPA